MKAEVYQIASDKTVLFSHFLAFTHAITMSEENKNEEELSSQACIFTHKMQKNSGFVGEAIK